jgi:lipoate-protein ligase A
MESTHWRLLLSGYNDGATNMATDHAIANAHRRGIVPPTLRFYNWRPFSVTLGYFQKATEGINVQLCQSLGLDLIRRPTGGRAILHEEEITFSITIHERFEFAVDFLVFNALK